MIKIKKISSILTNIAIKHLKTHAAEVSHCCNIQAILSLDSKLNHVLMPDQYNELLTYS